MGQNWKEWPVFGKTGTSESEKDVYFVGGTAYYCASSWFGYDNNQELNKSQTGYAKSLWSKAMTVLHEDLQIKDFAMPSGIEVLTYCNKTGLIATEKCKKTDTGVYKTVCKPDVCTCGNPVPEQPENPTDTTTPSGDPTGSTTVGSEDPTGSTTDTTDTTGGIGTTDPTASTEGTTAPTVPTTGTTAAPVTPGGDENTVIPTP